MKKLVFALSLAIGGSFTLSADVSGYAHSLDFAVTGYRGASTLVNFPMLVRLEEEVDGFSYGECLSPDGADLRFTLADGTELVHSVEEWNASGTSYVWVKVPALTAGLRLKMYWGKAGEAAPTASVFNESGYWSVLHCNEEGGAYADATGNGNDGVAAAATVADVTYTPHQTDGIIGKAVHLVGAELGQGAKGPSVRLANWANQTAIADTFTIGAWFRTAAVGQAPADDCLFGSQQFRLESHYGNPQNLRILDPGCNWVSVGIGSVLPEPINNGNWQHIVATFSGTDYQIYANGALRKTGTLAAPMRNESAMLGIGNSDTQGRSSFKGDIDDIRIAPSVLSADWIAAEYAQAAPKSRFLSLDGRVAYVVPAGTSGVTPTPPYQSWQTAATDLAEAIAGNANKDLILVAPGTYRISATLSVGDGIVLRSCDPRTGLRAPETTILDGTDCPNQIVSLSGGTLDGFTVCNANVPTGIAGGGIYVAASTASRLFNCIVRDNLAKQGGGMFLRSPSAAVITNCVFLRNGAETGGAVCSVDSTANVALPLFKDCTFATNRTTVTWGKGPVGYVGGGTFDGCLIRGNTTFDEKTYSSGFYSAYDFAVRNSRFCDQPSKSAYQGGSCFYGPATVSTTAFTGCSGNCIVNVDLIEACVFSNNAVCVYNEAGGRKTPTNVRNSLFTKNRGSCIFLRTDGLDVVIDNCTFADNKGSAVIQASTPNAVETRAVVRNSIFWANSGEDFAAWRDGNYLCATNSLLQRYTTYLAASEPRAWENLWNFDPKFTDAANGDYTILRRSPCRDAGIRLDWMTPEATDLTGNARIMKDGETQAQVPDALPDLGCHENALKPTGSLLLVR